MRRDDRHDGAEDDDGRKQDDPDEHEDQDESHERRSIASEMWKFSASVECRLTKWLVCPAVSITMSGKIRARTKNDRWDRTAHRVSLPPLGWTGAFGSYGGRP